MQLNRKKIVSTAVDILQQYGLADLTMRRLARALDVAPGALYWHFPNKQALLGGIAESILTAVPAHPGSAADYCSFLFDALTIALVSPSANRVARHSRNFSQTNARANLFHYRCTGLQRG